MTQIIAAPDDLYFLLQDSLSHAVDFQAPRLEPKPPRSVIGRLCPFFRFGFRSEVLGLAFVDLVTRIARVIFTEPSNRSVIYHTLAAPRGCGHAARACDVIFLALGSLHASVKEECAERGGRL